MALTDPEKESIKYLLRNAFNNDLCKRILTGESFNNPDRGVELKYSEGVDLFVMEAGQNCGILNPLWRRIELGGYGAGDIKRIRSAASQDRKASFYRAIIRMEVGCLGMTEEEFEGLKESYSKIMLSSLGSYKEIYDKMGADLTVFNPEYPRPIDALKHATFDELMALAEEVRLQKVLVPASALTPTAPTSMVTEAISEALYAVTPKGKDTNPVHQIGNHSNAIRAALTGSTPNIEAAISALDALMKAYEKVPNPGGRART